MSKLMVFLTENVSSGLRGSLSRWLLEVKPGVFVGKLTHRIGEKLWNIIRDRKGLGRSMWIYASNNEQGYKIETIGDYSRKVIDFDGLQLVMIPNRKIEKDNDNKNTNLNENGIGSTEREQGRVARELDLNNARTIKKDIIENRVEIKIGKKELDSKTIIKSDLVGSYDSESSKYKSSKYKSKPNKNIKIAQVNDTLKSKPALFLEDGFPVNFILREATYSLVRGRLHSEYSCRSSFSGITDDKLTNIWLRNWQVDIEALALQILSLIENNRHKILPYWSDKKVISFDLETTDYEPKIMEGFVNILGCCWIDFRENVWPVKMHILQVFNITRKRNLAPFLLSISRKAWDGADIGIVFNRKFDETLLKLLNKELKAPLIPLEFPSKIVDMMNDFRSLSDLEILISRRTGFRRLLTRKGMYKDYYRKFKGIGIAGKKPALEPIGSYNLTDALTPFLYSVLKLLNLADINR